MIEMTHEGLIGTRWLRNGGFYQVIFVEEYSLYVLADSKDGIAPEDFTFDNFDDLVHELTHNGWHPERDLTVEEAQALIRSLQDQNV